MALKISKRSSLVLLCLCFLFACSESSTKKGGGDEPENNGIVIITTDQGVQVDMGSSDISNNAKDADTNSDDAGLEDTSPDSGFDFGPDPDPNKLRIATWNIYFLDAEGEGEKVQRVASDYVRLNKYVTELNADLIALQEINGEAGIRALFPANIWDFECEERDSSQNVCVVLRKSKQWKIERHPDLISLQLGNPFLRAGLDFTISKPGFQSVRILAVHMKSGCFFGDGTDDCPTYFSQIDALEDWIDERAAGDEPYLLLGDFNRYMTSTDTEWNEINDGMPARATLMKSVAEGNTPCWGGKFSQFIDHIMLDDITRTWLESSAQLEFDETNFDAHYKNLSDHCPLWADLEVPTL